MPFQPRFNWLFLIIFLIILFFLTSQNKETNSTKPQLFDKSDSNTSNITPTMLLLGEEIQGQLFLPRPFSKDAVKRAVLEHLPNHVSFEINKNKESLKKTEIKSESQSIQTTIYASYSVSPDCYRDGSDGATGDNFKTDCCNCGYLPRKGDCDRYTSDCGDPSQCCINLGCLNDKKCQGKPAIWDPESGECGC